jgi:sigma-B regulation protein RsbU (phosphoserine phosphatase)
VITLVDEGADTSMRTLVRTMVTSVQGHMFHLDECVLGWMHLHKIPLLVNDPQNDERFRGIRWDPSVRTLLAVPLLVKSKLIGVLTVYNKKSEDGFSEEDQRLLAILASQSAQVVENARLYEEEQALLRMREEMRVASEIQQRLLPKSPPRLTGYDIAGLSIPTEDVGGDYFDFIPLEGNRLAFCLGDVSGKGLPAALLMANLQGTMRGQAPSSASPRECLERANRLLYRSTEPDRFATIFFGILDPAEHLVSYSSAGHERPILLRGRGSLEHLEAGGLILSFMEECRYEDASVRMEPGDTLVVFSDGITDALNAEGEPYTEDRLMRRVAEGAGSPAQELLERILADLREHIGDHMQFDDMTLVVIQRRT